MVVQRLGFALAFQLFFETLQQTVVDAQHPAGAAVEALNHLFDRKIVGLVGVAQTRRQQLLVIEAQTLFAAFGHQMQAEAQPRQRFAFAFERVEFHRADLPERQHRFQVSAAQQPLRHPAQRLDIAQPTGAVFQIGFEIVRGIAETRMTLRLFLHFGAKKFTRRPNPIGRNRAFQRILRSVISGQHAPLHHRGQHGLVRGRFDTLRWRAHHLTRLQARVPQQRKKARQRIGMRLRHLVFCKHQQIDIGLRKQFAAAVAADREQRQTGIDRHTACPGVADQRVGGRRTQCDQTVDAVA